MQNIRQLLERPIYRYIIVGVSVYALELIIIMTLTKLNFSPIVAVSISFWFGLITSFVLQKLLTFGDRRTHHKVVITQLIAFGVLVLFNFGFTVLVTKIFTPEIPPTVARTIALGITTLWNFYLYKTKIFNKPIT